MVAKNFNFLYRYYKDKQEVLAQMLHVPQSNISAYINGKKPIPTDVLNNISIRYNVPIDDLVNKDLSVEFDSPQTVTLDDAAHIAERMFPILTSNVAKTNDNFNRAYELLVASLQLEDVTVFCKCIRELERAVTLFQKAWEESDTYVALANSLSTILLVYAFYTQRGIKIGQALLNSGAINTFVIKSTFLRNPNKPDVINPYEDEKI